MQLIGHSLVQIGVSVPGFCFCTSPALIASRWVFSTWWHPNIAEHAMARTRIEIVSAIEELSFISIVMVSLSWLVATRYRGQNKPHAANGRQRSVLKSMSSPPVADEERSATRQSPFHAVHGSDGKGQSESLLLGWFGPSCCWPRLETCRMSTGRPSQNKTMERNIS